MNHTKHWDLRSFEAWIVDEFIPGLWVGPGPGDFARRPKDPATALYGAADAACILYSLDRLDSDAALWLATLGAFQDEPSGFFVDRSGQLSTAHNTGFATAAMKLLEPDLRNGELPRWPLRFGELVAHPGDAERYAATLDWRSNCYEAGENLIGHAATFFNVADVVPLAWFDWLVEYVEHGKLDPASGMVGVDKPPQGDLDQVGGTFHFDFMWASLGRRLPNPEARASALLGLQQPGGLWASDNPWWLTFDAIYMLGRTLPELSPQRSDEVLSAISRAVTVVAARAGDSDRRTDDFVEPWIGAHILTGAVSLFAYAQQVLGIERVITSRPLRLVLDRRPYI